MPRNETGYELLGSVFDVEIILVNIDYVLIEAKTTERIVIVISWYWYIRFILFSVIYLMNLYLRGRSQEDEFVTDVLS